MGDGPGDCPADRLRACVRACARALCYKQLKQKKTDGKKKRTQSRLISHLFRLFHRRPRTLRIPMGQSESSANPPPPRRNGAPDHIWEHATSDLTIAAGARLEALASVSSDPDEQPEESATEGDMLVYRMRLRRLCYSSVLTAVTPEGAKAILTKIFMHALINNPKKQIGGILFYDEQTGAIVQVIEGPFHHVRTLFYGRILRDPRHTKVRKLWDIDVHVRRHETFGMKCGEIDLASEAPGLDTPQLLTDASLVRLTYSSRLLAHQSITAYRMVMEILRSSIRHNAQVNAHARPLQDVDTPPWVGALGGVTHAHACLIIRITPGPFGHVADGDGTGGWERARSHTAYVSQGRRPRHPTPSCLARTLVPGADARAWR